LNSEALNYLHMKDLDVDDDEWQLAAWYFEDQNKERPLAILDYHNELFGTSATYRTQQRDEGFIVFSRDHFSSMYGDMPEESFKVEDIPMFPYEYDRNTERWTNSFTNESPLVMHFPGNDWLSGCQVFRAEGFDNIPPKFRDNCEENHHEQWLERVEQALGYVAEADDPLEEVFLLNDEMESWIKARDGIMDEADQKRFHLDDATVHRMLDDDPYNGPVDENIANTSPSLIDGIINVLLFPFRLILDFISNLLSLIGIGGTSS